MGILDNDKAVKQSGTQDTSGEASLVPKEDPITEIVTFIPKENETLWSKLDSLLPYLKYNTANKFKKLDYIAKYNGMDNIHAYKAGQKILIPITESEKQRANRMPQPLPNARKEQSQVMKWAEESGVPLQVIMGEDVTEEEYKQQKHTGIQYFILHGSKTQGLMMNEHYSKEYGDNDGYLNKKEIAKQDFSEVPMVIVNGCESDHVLDGFLEGGADKTLGYFYRILDEVAAEVGPEVIKNSHQSDPERMHEFVRNKMKDLRANGRKLIYWSNLIDKYQQYSAEKFGSVDSYQLNKEHLGSTSVEQEKQIREEARGDMHLRADRADLAKSQRELRKKEQELAKHPKSEALQKEVNDLQTKYTVQKKQIHLQHLVNNQEGGEERSSQVQELLKKGEAVVEIKRMEGKSKQENGVTMPSEASYMALINLPGLTSPRAIYLGEEYLLSRYAVHHNNDLMFLNLHDSENAKAFELLWKGIDDFLIKNNVKRIYFKSEGVYADFNINTLFDRKQLVFDKYDVQYLY